jgi:hypothetical protein
MTLPYQRAPWKGLALTNKATDTSIVGTAICTLRLDQMAHVVARFHMTDSFLRKFLGAGFALNRG